MANPWEKYATQPATSAPWEKYAKSTPAPTAPAAATPEPYQSGLRKVPFLGGLLGTFDENLVTPGIEKMAGGFERMTGMKDPRYQGPPPGSESRTSAVLGGASDLARGAAQGMSLPFMVANPIRSAIGVGVGALAQPALQRTAEDIGAQPGTAQFLGDAGAAALGAGAVRRAGQASEAFQSGLNPPPRPLGPLPPSRLVGRPQPAPPPMADVTPIKTPLPSGRAVPGSQPVPKAAPIAEQPTGLRPFGQPDQEVPTLPATAPRGPLLPRLQQLSQRADQLGYERPAASPLAYTPPRAEVIPHPEAVKPEAQAIAQQLADEMRKSGTLPPEEEALPLKGKKK